MKFALNLLVLMAAFVLAQPQDEMNKASHILLKRDIDTVGRRAPMYVVTGQF